MQLQRELNQPGLPSPANAAEVPFFRYIATRVKKLRVVEDVKEL
jgi:hypothetical protein